MGDVLGQQEKKGSRAKEKATTKEEINLRFYRSKIFFISLEWSVDDIKKAFLSAHPETKMFRNKFDAAEGAKKNASRSRRASNFQESHKWKWVFAIKRKRKEE